MSPGWLLFSLVALAPPSAGPLPRRRRWLVFPKGSSLQLVYCWLLSTFGTRDGIFVINITVGLAWEIPRDLRRLLEKESRPAIESRHRRQIYSRLGTILDRQGLEGRTCILRGICESKRTAGSKQKFVHSMLQGLLSNRTVVELYTQMLGVKSVEVEFARSIGALRMRDRTLQCGYCSNVALGDRWLLNALDFLNRLPDLDENHEEYPEHNIYKKAEAHLEDCERHYPCPLQIFNFK